MSDFFAKLFSALCNRTRRRSAAPKPRRAMLSILPLEDRITPATVGGWGSSMYQYSNSDPLLSVNPVSSVRVTFNEAINHADESVGAGPSVSAYSIVIDPRVVDQLDKNMTLKGQKILQNAALGDGSVRVVSPGVAGPASAGRDIAQDPVFVVIGTWSSAASAAPKTVLGDGSVRVVSPGVASGANAFDGRFLSARDLTRDQDYLREMMPFGNFTGGVRVGSGAELQSFFAFQGFQGGVSVASSVGTFSKTFTVAIHNDTATHTVALASARWESVITGDLPNAT